MTVLNLQQLEPDSCEGCGLCCQGIGSPVLLYQTDVRISGSHPFQPPGLPSNLIAEIDDHFGGLRRGEEPQEQCLWFDPIQRQCRHYEWRPQFCRDFELGGTACLILRQSEADV
ncbi:MAG TPA: zinc/iron-chelating domain-containing protein [Planctomycetaceae bacterium]|nr:zinc/iron-chelating domain-containing protein [Planctomycetaceae bacterium]